MGDIAPVKQKLSENPLDKRALALFQKVLESREDKTQGASVKVGSGGESVELSITQKPGQGYRGSPGAADVAHTVEEVEAACKAAGFKQADYKVWVEEGKVFCKWPYEQRDNATMAALFMKWDTNAKARWSPLKGAPAPS